MVGIGSDHVFAAYLGHRARNSGIPGNPIEYFFYPVPMENETS